MIKQDFIMLIMNCKKYANKAAFQKKTWLPLIPDYLIYYHVIGSEDLDTSYKFDDDNKILWVKTLDDYNSLPTKVITAYNAVNETFNYKYIFKTDDDQILVKPAFFDIVCNLIKSMNPSPHYGGYVVDVQRPYLSQYHRIHPELPSQLPIYKTKYCSGRFYFLSNEAVLNLLSKREKIIREYLEDYAIGYNLDSCLKINMLSLATNKFFTDIELSDFNKFEIMNKGRN
jgi:hypothetical protein